MYNDQNKSMRDKTVKYDASSDDKYEVRKILEQVYSSLDEKGYNPINQLIGYFMSGDPTYITSYNNARTIIRERERDELLEEILKDYLEHNDQ